MSSQGSRNFLDEGNAYADYGASAVRANSTSSFTDIESEMWDEVLSCYDDETNQYIDA